MKVADGDEQRRPVTLYNAASLPPAGANTLDACTTLHAGGCIFFVVVVFLYFFVSSNLVILIFIFCILTLWTRALRRRHRQRHWCILLVFVFLSLVDLVFKEFHFVFQHFEHLHWCAVQGRAGANKSGVPAAKPLNRRT